MPAEKKEKAARFVRCALEQLALLNFHWSRGVCATTDTNGRRQTQTSTSM